MAYYLGEHRVEFDKDVVKAVSAAIENGMQVSNPDQALTDALAEFVQADEAVLIADAKSRGIDDAEDILAEYKRIVDRWATLLADVDHTDVDALAALARSEIYDNLDPETYGIE